MSDFRTQFNQEWDRRTAACVKFCDRLPTELLEKLIGRRIGAATFIQWLKRNLTFRYDDDPSNYQDVCIECDHVVETGSPHGENCLLAEAMEILDDKP